MSVEDASHDNIGAVGDEIQRAVVLEDEFLETVLSAIVPGGHVLLEDVPGTGKTVTAQAIARSLGLEFSRIQFTPDLLPYFSHLPTQRHLVALLGTRQGGTLTTWHHRHDCMGLFRSDELLGIAGETLSFVLNAAAETHPNEYMGYLRAERASTLGLDREGRVITDVIVIPGTVSNPKSARVQSIMKPNASRSVGSVHSHPSGVLRPSQTDLDTFQNGDVHIIVGAPYEWTDWKAFDSDGNPTNLDVLDVEVPDAEDFFDFTQEDIDRELASEDDASGGILSWFR